MPSLFFVDADLLRVYLGNLWWKAHLVDACASASLIEDLAPKFLKKPVDKLKFKKASVWVLSFNNGELTGADYLASPLPVR